VARQQEHEVMLAINGVLKTQNLHEMDKWSKFAINGKYQDTRFGSQCSAYCEHNKNNRREWQSQQDNPDCMNGISTSRIVLKSNGRASRQKT
jgi:hypothetical protein